MEIEGSRDKKTKPCFERESGLKSSSCSTCQPVGPKDYVCHDKPLFSEGAM